MPRGGFRPGAGRPKGAVSGKKKPAPKPKAAPKKKAGAAPKKKPTKPLEGEFIPAIPPQPSATDQVVDGTFVPKRRDPLEFMLDVMNDPMAEQSSRERMAVAAAPYCHVRKGDGGKKEAKKDAAGSVASGRFAPAPPPTNTRRPN